MTTSRSFVIQRYCQSNWPEVCGERPFITTGPKFFNWAIKGSLAKHSEYRFVPSLKENIDSVLKAVEPSLARECVASLLLREGIIQALWAVHSESKNMATWEASVDTLSRQIPQGSIGDEVIEMLSGMGSPEHCRSYTSEDCISFIPIQIADDGL